MNYVFERDYALLARLKVPAGARGTIPIRAEAHWLACTDRICVPEEGQLSLELPVGSGSPNRALFDRWRQALPQPLATLGHFEASGNKLRVSIPLPASVRVNGPYVFPLVDGPVDYDARQEFRRSGDMSSPSSNARATWRESSQAWSRSAPGAGSSSARFRARCRPDRRFAASAGTHFYGPRSGRCAGGILLNLMPCVFPILALKALHVSRAGGERGEARSRRSCLCRRDRSSAPERSAAALLALRAAGTQAGWAFQLQDPRTIMLLLLLGSRSPRTSLGLFELPVLGGSAPPRRQLRDRSSRRIRRYPLRGPVPRSSAWNRASSSRRRIGARLRSARARPRLTVRAACVRSDAPQAIAEAGGVDAPAAALSRLAHGPQYARRGLAIISPRRRDFLAVRALRIGSACDLPLFCRAACSAADAGRPDLRRCSRSSCSSSRSRWFRSRPSLMSSRSPAPNRGARHESPTTSGRDARSSSISRRTGASAARSTKRRRSTAARSARPSPRQA